MQPYSLLGGVLERKSRELPRLCSMDEKKAEANRGPLKGVHSRGCRLKKDAMTLETRLLGWLVLGVGTYFCLGTF